MGCIPDTIIITPTVGSAHLRTCLQSVQLQTVRNLEHWVVVDGAERARYVSDCVSELKSPHVPIRVHVLQHNTGKGRYHGYRICAAYACLAESQNVLFLDDDNWYDPSHVATVVASVDVSGTNWGFALRRVVREDGRHLVDDDCDSLGFWRRADSYRGPSDMLAPEFIDFHALYPFLVDTNCYVFRAAFLRRVAHLLIDHPKGDAYLANHLVRTEAGACTGRRTVNYRARKSDEARLLEYFVRGNGPTLDRFDGVLPWHRPMRCDALEARVHADQGGARSGRDCPGRILEQGAEQRAAEPLLDFAPVSAQ